MDKQLSNCIKLFEYLEKLSLLNTNVRKNIKNLSSGEEKFDLENEDFLPDLDKIFLKNKDLESDKNDDLFLSIERYKIEKPPKLPKQLDSWIELEPSTFIKPEPREFLVKTEKFDDEKKRIIAFKKLDESSRIGAILKDWVIKNDYGNYEKINEKPKRIYFEDYPELKKLYTDWVELK